jgi:hypothetical protein
MTRDTSARDGLGCSGVSVIVPPSWTSTFTWSAALKRARSINAASRINRCALPILKIVLAMMLNDVLRAGGLKQAGQGLIGHLLEQVEGQRLDGFTGGQAVSPFREGRIAGVAIAVG